MAGIEEIQREIAATHAFVKERVDPLRGEVDMVREEQQRLAAEVREALGQQQERRRDALRSDERIRVRGGKLDGADLVDLAIVCSLMRAQLARPQDYDPRMLKAWEQTVQRAMDSATAGAGAELVPQEEARSSGRTSTLRQLWRRCSTP